MTTQIIYGDCRQILPTLESNSVQCIVTSPHYCGQRDYGVDGQLGLAQEGTLWLNYGDPFHGAGTTGLVCKTRTTSSSRVSG